MHTEKLLNSETYNSLSLLIKLSITCGLSAFYFGYCTTYFNCISFDDIIVIFGLYGYPRGLTQGLLIGSTCFTGAIGTILSVKLISSFSRRESLMILSFLSLILTAISLVPSIYTLVFVRLCQGFLIGSISCITPLYIREMIPKEVSGPMWSLHQVLYVIGVTFGFILSYFLSIFYDPLESWRIIFGFPFFTSTIQLICFGYLFRFDTPKWYIINHKLEEAKHSIRMIYKEKYQEEILKDLMEANNYIKPNRLTNISDAYEASAELEHLEIDGYLKNNDIEMKPIQARELENFTQTNEIKPNKTNNSLAVFTAFFLAIQQHCYGAIIVIQFANEMALKTFPSLDKLLPVVLSMFSFVGSIVSIQLTRSYGRKDILTVGALCAFIGLFAGFIIFSTFDIDNIESNSFFLRIVLFIFFIDIRLSMTIAMGPVISLYITEIIQPNLTSWCYFANWTTLGIISVIFPIFCEWNLGNPNYAFLFFAMSSAVSLLVNLKVLVETRNKSELEIRKEFDQKCS